MSCGIDYMRRLKPTNDLEASRTASLKQDSDLHTCTIESLKQDNDLHISTIDLLKQNQNATNVKTLHYLKEYKDRQFPAM